MRIPSVAEMATLYDATIHEEKWADDIAYLSALADASGEKAIESRVRLALISGGDTAADAVLGDIKPSDILDPAQKNFHAECPLIYYAVWNNSGGHHPQGDDRFYHYLVSKEPECVKALGPGGETMLHSWFGYNGKSLSILQDLLERGVDPLQPDRDGKTAMDMWRERAKRYEASDPELTLIEQMMQQAIHRQASVKKWTTAFPPGSSGDREI